MSVQEELQGGRMEGGCREEEEEEEEEEDDVAGYSKRVRDEEQNRDEAQREDGCWKKRRIRSENWSAEETEQMLQLRKAIVQTSIAKGSDAWKQIAHKLDALNPDSQARSSKQVAQRWDTLVKVYVSVEEQCCASGRSYGEVIDDRQKRCKADYRQLWHELIAQGNPGKRRAGKTSLQSGASQSVTSFVRKFGEIAKSFTEMLDIIDCYMTASEERNEDFGLQANKNIETDFNWEPEGLDATAFVLSGLKKQQDLEAKAEVARATQSLADTMQSISKVPSTSGSFCLEVDQKDWLMVIQGLSAFSQRFQTISVQGIRDEVAGAHVHIPNSQEQTVSAMRPTHDHANNPIQHSLSLPSSFYIINGMICKRTLSSLNTKRSEKSCSSGRRDGSSTPSPTTSTGNIFDGLLDIEYLSPKSDCESGSRWLEPEQANSHRKSICTTSSVEKEGKKEKKKKTERPTSIIKFRQNLASEEVGEKGSRNMTRTMTRFGPRGRGFE